MMKMKMIGMDDVRIKEKQFHQQRIIDLISVLNAIFNNQRY